MIIINTTFIIASTMVNDVLKWIKNTYVDSAVNSGALKDMTLLTKILNNSEDGSESYALHIGFCNMSQASQWDNKLGARLRKILSERWGQNALTFHTYMEVME